MRNIFLFLWRSYFFLLFLLLEVVSFYLIIQNNNYQKSSFINSTNAVSASIYSNVSNITEYLRLKSANEALAKENALLRAQAPSAFYNNIVMRSSVEDSSFRQKYTYITAKVINNSVNKRNNYLTLNRGSLHGIKKDMGVISSNGIVGIVKEVSPHYCSVLSLLHKDTKISAKIAKSDYFGSILWEGGDSQYATLHDIPKHVVLKSGDRIITTSYSAIFPEGITIGTIVSGEVKPGDNFHTIKVLLSTNFQNITHVYIVNNLMKEEQTALEQETLKNDQ
jgi:rod shape-determining protein MreC